jgi:hypothetical protein
MRCSSCGADLPERASHCPECESPITNAGDGDTQSRAQSDPSSSDFRSETQSTESQQRPSKDPPSDEGPNPQPSRERQTGGEVPSGQQARQPPDQSGQTPGQPEQQSHGQPGSPAPDGPAGEGQGQPGPGQSPRQAQPTPSGGQGRPGQHGPGQPRQQGQPAQQTQRGRRGQGTSFGDLLDSIPFVGGLFYGIVAFVVNFVVTNVLVVAVAGEGDLTGYVYAVTNEGLGYLDIFGWFFYSAHTVDIVASSGSQSNSENFIETFYSAVSNPSIPKIAIYLAPLLVLFVLALVLASRASLGDDSTGFDGALAGGSIALGYAAFTLLGIFVLFSYTATGGQGTIQPALGSSVVFMCLLYPLGSGGLAGYLVGR